MKGILNAKNNLREYVLGFIIIILLSFSHSLIHPTNRLSSDTVTFVNTIDRISDCLGYLCGFGGFLEEQWL